MGQRVRLKSSFVIPPTWAKEGEALLLGLLSASNGVHAVAYDAVVLTVAQTIALEISRAGTNVTLIWARLLT